MRRSPTVRDELERALAFAVEERTRVRERVVALATTDGQRRRRHRFSGSRRRRSVVGYRPQLRRRHRRRSTRDPRRRTAILRRELDVVHHWDLLSGGTIYRVYLLPGGLELDIAVTPEAEFGSRGAKFAPLFGEPVSAPPTETPAAEAIGFGWLYALNARTAIVRRRLWAAEYWISALRAQTLGVASPSPRNQRRALPQ